MNLPRSSTMIDFAFPACIDTAEQSVCLSIALGLFSDESLTVLARNLSSGPDKLSKAAQDEINRRKQLDA